jgi:hypothetical protein
MRWEELFDDLEGQAESLERVEREAEVADRTRSELGQITLISRLRSNEGRGVSLRLTGGASFSGTIVRLGADWMLLSCPGEVVVPLTGVATVANLPWSSMSPYGVEAVTSRLTLSSVFRAMAVDRARITIALCDQSTVSGTPDRVGRDFVDVAVHHGDEAPRTSAISMRTTVAYSAISAVLRDPGTWA